MRYEDGVVTDVELLAVGGGPIADIVLPASQRTALIQVIVVLAATIAVTYLVRRERSLVLLVVGIGTVLLALMSLRTAH